jgi:hypothetical protein
LTQHHRVFLSCHLHQVVPASPLHSAEKNVPVQLNAINIQHFKFIG